MDRLIYIAAGGARQEFERQASAANNAANSATVGFRRQLDAFRAVPLSGGAGEPTRTFVVTSTPGADFTPGPIMHTGRALDVAVQGNGWLTVQGADGREAYTRAGNIQVDPNGQLTLDNGLAVLGDNGPLAVPPGAQVTIGDDGTVSVLSQGDPPNAVAVMGKLKLVNPPPASLARGDDGLFRRRDGAPEPGDPNVSVLPGALEGSNANPVQSMVAMLDSARRFEMQMKLLQTADADEQQANQLLSLS